MEKARILIVDDEETLRTGVATYLELEGYRADIAADAEEALTLDLSTYDLVVLDVMMGRMSGFDLLRKMRVTPGCKDIPVIFLTAKDTDDDMVAGLQLGADDFITKPFSLRNLKARIEAVLRRSLVSADTARGIGHEQPAETAAVSGTDASATDNGVVCDRLSQTCLVDGREVLLPRKELEILILLKEHPGRIFSREEVLARVWPDNVVVSDRTVDVHVTRLRGKIAPYGSHIITRSGYGYGWKD